MENKQQKHSPAQPQQFSLLYTDEGGRIKHELFEGKVPLRNRVSELDPNDILFVMAGRQMSVKVERKITLGM